MADNSVALTHIIETAFAHFAQNSIPIFFWDDARLTTCYLINCMPTPILYHKSPFQISFHRDPNYNFLKNFGCACYPHHCLYNKHKI